MKNVITLDGTEKLIYSPVYSRASSLYIGSSRQSDSWRYDPLTEITTTNYCVIHITNAFTRYDNKNLYLRETHHESRNGYMHYYYVTKEYKCFVEDTDKSKVPLSNGLGNIVHFFEFDTDAQEIPAGGKAYLEGYISNLDELVILGVCGLKLYSNADKLTLTGHFDVDTNGHYGATVINNSNSNITTKVIFKCAVINKGE